MDMTIAPPIASGRFHPTLNASIQPGASMRPGLGIMMRSQGTGVCMAPFLELEDPFLSRLRGPEANGFRPWTLSSRQTTYF